MRLTRLIHDDVDVARKVFEIAAARLQSTADAQRKRLYYGTSPKRSKVYFPLPSLLHMLVFAESEAFERYGEQCGITPAETIRIRYVKHLIWIAARRNSFHVALAICRLLFHYTTADTMAIYDSLLQEKDFLKEDYYYRARKRVLMRESEHRFPGLVRATGPHAEERFVPDSEQESWLDLVLDTLEACTPWGTQCLDDPRSMALAGFDDEAELARLHVLIHPPCFEAVVLGVGLESPHRRLAMPLFHSENATLGVARAGTMAAAGATANATDSRPPA